MENSKYDKLMQYALRLISKKRYTVYEIEQKLTAYCKKWISESDESDEQKIFDEAVLKVIARLKELRYLNDHDYVDCYIKDRVAFKPRGVYVLKRELKKKGISKELIEKFFLDNDIDELEMARRLLESKKRIYEKDEPKKQRDKAFRFLSSKGIKLDTIYKCLDSYYDNKVF